jgi:transcriptional regulator with XRE-family HTH domain
VSGQITGQTGFRFDRLNAEIDRLSLTNDEVAQALQIPERSLRRWRKGETAPRRRTARRLAEYFDREPSWFYDPEAAAA